MLETIVQAPFIRLLVAFSIGIALRLTVNIPQPIILTLLLLTLGTAIGLSALNKVTENFRLRWVFGFNLHLFLIVFGIYITEQKLYKFENGLKKSESPVEMLGIISEPPECRAKSVRCYLNIDQVKELQHFKKVTEKILVYFHKDSASLGLRAGDVLLLKTAPGEVDISGNPFEFDYRRYLANKGIRYTAYTDSSSWKCLSHKKLPLIVQWADELRQKLLGIFSGLGMTGDELAVASSLVIGDQSGLDDEIKRAYTTSGTMHILAVSGMHVALIYEILIILLVFLNRIKYGKYLKLFIILSIIWIYSLITGLPASVLRASTMFTFIILGEITDRPSNIFNSLACSAFFLLLVNPGNLVDVGFQLSYLAVVSIVVFYPLIYKLFSVKNYILNQVWAITAVTLAAQIGTSPISLYYFHQFPNLFVLSNLIIIPLSTLIIYFAIVLIIFSGWHWAAYFLGRAFNFSVWLLNKTVLTIEKVPYAVTQGIYITGFDVLLLYLIVCLVSFYLLRKQPIYLTLCLSIVFLFEGIGIINSVQSFKAREVIVYNERDNTIVQFRSGKQSVWLVEKHNERVDRFVNRARDGMKCPENIVLQMDSAFLQTKKNGTRVNDVLWIHGNFIQFYTKRIAIMDGKEVLVPGNRTIDMDYVLFRRLSGNVIGNVLSRYKPRTVILSSYFSKFKAQIFKRQFNGKSVNVYSTGISGALKITL